MITGMELQNAIISIRGKLYKSTKTPDGYQVNEKGQWIVNNVVQTKLVK